MSLDYSSSLASSRNQTRPLLQRSSDADDISTLPGASSMRNKKVNENIRPMNSANILRNILQQALDLLDSEDLFETTQ